MDFAVSKIHKVFGVYTTIWIVSLLKTSSICLRLFIFATISVRGFHKAFNVPYLYYVTMWINSGSPIFDSNNCTSSSARQMLQGLRNLLCHCSNLVFDLKYFVKNLWGISQTSALDVLNNIIHCLLQNFSRVSFGIWKLIILNDLTVCSNCDLD